MMGLPEQSIADLKSGRSTAHSRPYRWRPCTHSRATSVVCPGTPANCSENSQVGLRHDCRMRLDLAHGPLRVQ